MTIAGEAFSPAEGVAAKAIAGARFDKLGAAVAAIVAVGLIVAPFATLKANRIVSGKGFGFFDALPAGAALPGAALILAAALIALLRARPELRLAAGAAALAGALVLIGFVPAHLAPSGAPLARVAPAAGFWMLVFAFGVLLADALAKLQLGPLGRIATLAAAALFVAVLLGSGAWDGLSTMREYAAHADTFWRAGARHIELAFGSLAAALLVGLPLGVACQRLAGLRSVTLPVLGIIQTVPSIAMFGLLMAPLGALAARSPLLSAIGVKGVGAAPALVALFL